MTGRSEFVALAPRAGYLAAAKTIWAISSAGRALARQARGHWFKSSIAHHFARAVARPRSQGPSRCVRDRPLIWNRRKRTDDVGTEAVRRSGFPGRPL